MKSRAILAFLLAVLFLLPVASCERGGTDETKLQDAFTDAPADDDGVKNTQTSAQELALYDGGCTNNLLCGVDMFGRSFDASAGERAEDKQVGMFFFLWLGQPFGEEIYDAGKIFAEHGKQVLFLEADDTVSPENQPHWWGEPLWGYYNSADPWVINRQIELLTLAGVDFIVFDTTNRVTYPVVYKRIMKTIEAYQNAGKSPPKVAFYIQLIQNIRKYKYNAPPSQIASGARTIDILAGEEQWADIGAVYKGAAYENEERDYYGGARTVRYTQPAARNFITEVRVANDTEHIYLLIKCDSDITEGDMFMNIFIGRKTPSAKGWEGYEFVIKDHANGISSVYALTPQAQPTEYSARYIINGSYMQVEFDIEVAGGEHSLYFKVADNISSPGDIMDYYVSGCSFPLGRLSYKYYIKEV